MINETQAIYDKHFRESFNLLRHYRDKWLSTSSKLFIGDSLNFANIWNDENSEYQFILSESKIITTNALFSIVTELFTTYGYKIKSVPICAKGFLELKINSSDRAFKASRSTTNPFLGLLLEYNGNRILFVFREFGIQNRLPNEMIKELIKQNKLTAFYYVSWIADNAYEEVLNHNDNEHDPSRGTGIYSLKYIITRFFGDSEYSNLLKAFEKYKSDVHDYFGIKIVKILRPNALFSFKADIRRILASFDYAEAFLSFSTHTISSEQKMALDTQFTNASFLNALTGHSSFAKCFMTAEWL